MPTFTEFDLQNLFRFVLTAPMTPWPSASRSASSFEMFDDIDDLKLQEVMTEVMRYGLSECFCSRLRCRCGIVFGRIFPVTTVTGWMLTCV